MPISGVVNNERKNKMNKLMVIVAAAMCAAMFGCTSTTVETPEWKAKIANHWFARDVDKFTVNRLADGSYTIALNGYKEDVSEQFPAFTREMWAGLGIIGRLAAATINPASSAVPLTAEAADADKVSQLVKAKSEADAKLVKAKAEAAAIQKTMQAFAAAGGNVATANVTCADGSCTVTDGTVTCKDGSCSIPTAN